MNILITTILINFLFSQVISIPKISGLSGTFKQGESITILGTDFLDKPNLPHLLYDTVDNQESYDSLNHDDVIITSDPENPWSEQGSSWANDMKLYKESTIQRTSFSTMNYYFDQKGFFRLPRYERTEYSPENLYVNWWINYSKGLYRKAIDLTGITGNFQIGETIQVDGESDTAVVDDVFNSILYIDEDWSEHVGKGVTGITSGASGTINEYFGGGSNKFIRIWDEGNGNGDYFLHVFQLTIILIGMRISWTSMHLSHGGDTDWGMYGNGGTNQWINVEIWVNRNEGIIKTWKDGKVVNVIYDGKVVNVIYDRKVFRTD